MCNWERNQNQNGNLSFLSVRRGIPRLKIINPNDKYRELYFVCLED